MTTFTAVRTIHVAINTANIAISDTNRNSTARKVKIFRSRINGVSNRNLFIFRLIQPYS